MKDLFSLQPGKLEGSSFPGSSFPVCIHRLFEERARSCPSSIAFDMMGNCLTYGQVTITRPLPTSNPLTYRMAAPGHRLYPGSQVILRSGEPVDGEGTGSKYRRWDMYRRGRLHDSRSARCSNGWCRICSCGHEPAATVM